MHPVGELVHGLAQVQADQRRNLIIAGSAGAEPATEIGAKKLDQPALESAMHILVGLGWAKRSGRHFGCELVQARADFR